MIPRTIVGAINRLITKFPVISVTGPRQSGKTTILKSAFSDYTYVSLENPDILQFAVFDPRGFLAQYPKRCIFDEVQRAPTLFSFLQQVVDDENEPGMFILSGSQNFLLVQGITQSLAGRVAVLKLLPFGREELAGSGSAPASINEALFWGAYPRLFDKKIVPVDYYTNYLMTYVERDVRQMKNISDLATFRRFLGLCAGRCGSLLNLVALGNDCGITHNTARAWLSVLEASYIVFLLQPYHRNFSKRLTKTPKLYFFDTGIVCSLLGIRSSGELSNHAMQGQLFENYVISEFMKAAFHRGRSPDLFFWRDKTGHEIDCIIAGGEHEIPVEIKSAQTVCDDFFRNIRYFNKLRRERGGSVIYGGEEMQRRTEATVFGWKNFMEAYRAFGTEKQADLLI
ncbi:MAG: ATP-binding protein [Candidatus Latescibacteria bacterium]|nr:ATP-binding protein [Candidatus Latescibacterota bacterium]